MNKKVFAALFMAIFCATLGNGLVVPLLPVYAHDLGASGLLVGFIFAAFSLSRTVFVPLFGRLSDLKGRKPFLTLGLAAYVLVSAAFSMAGNVELLIVLRFLQGIASAMIMPVAQAYIGEISPTHKEGFTMGLFNLSLYAGLSAGPVLGGVANDALGIRAAFWGMGVMCLLGFCLCGLFLPPHCAEKGPARAGQPAGYGVLIRNRHVLSLFVFRLAITTCVGAVWAFLPLLADTHFHLSSSATGVLVMLNVLTTGLLQTPMGLVADRVDKRLLITLGGAISALAVFLFLGARGFWGLFCANLFFGIGGGISLPAVMAAGVIVGRRTEAMGSVMALLAMGHSLGMLVGPVLAGAIMDAFSLRYAFVAGTVVMALGTGLFWPLAAGYEKGENPLREGGKRRRN